MAEWVGGDGVSVGVSHGADGVLQGVTPVDDGRGQRCDTAEELFRDLEICHADPGSIFADSVGHLRDMTPWDSWDCEHESRVRLEVKQSAFAQGWGRNRSSEAGRARGYDSKSAAARRPFVG